MATFSVIDAGKAPPKPRPAGPSKVRMTEYEGFLDRVKKGQVGKLIPAARDTPRGVAVRISRAGKRVGKAVDAWVVDGVVYFKLK